MLTVHLSSTEPASKALLFLSGSLSHLPLTTLIISPTRSPIQSPTSTYTHTSRCSKALSSIHNILRTKIQSWSYTHTHTYTRCQPLPWQLQSAKAPIPLLQQRYDSYSLLLPTLHALCPPLLCRCLLFLITHLPFSSGSPLIRTGWYNHHKFEKKRPRDIFSFLVYFVWQGSTWRHFPETSGKDTAVTGVTKSKCWQVGETISSRISSHLLVIRSYFCSAFVVFNPNLNLLPCWIQCFYPTL